MTDATIKKKKFGTGICWDYMDKGSCPCSREISHFARRHPRLSVTTVAAPTASGAAVTVASMSKRVPEWIESLRHLGFVEGDPENFAVLNTSYGERLEAKALGATYSPVMRKWIVPRGIDLGPFARWEPRVNNRGADDVVLHNPSVDRASAVREMMRLGFCPSHFDIRGWDAEADAVRVELSAMQRRRRDNRDNDAGNVTKRPRFSNLECMYASARERQNERRGANTRPHGMESKEDWAEEGGPQEELCALLSTAKSSLARCNSGGAISQEQKQFNKAIYNVVEALAAKLDMPKKWSAASDGIAPTNQSTPAHAKQRQKMVTPSQKIMMDDRKTPGAHDFSYGLTE